MVIQQCCGLTTTVLVAVSGLAVAEGNTTSDWRPKDQRTASSGNSTPVRSSESIQSRFAISTSDAAAVRPDERRISTLPQQTARTDITSSREILARSEQGGSRSGLVGLCEEPIADFHHPVLHATLAAELKICSRIAWMCRDSSDRRVGCGQPTLELECEQQVGQLRLLVRGPGPVCASFPVEVVQRNRAATVRPGGDGHHSIGHVRQQQVGEREVAEVVGADLQLKAIGSTPFGCPHHPSVVDQHAQLTLPALGEGAYRGEVGKIELANLTVAGNGLGGRFALGNVPNGEDDMCTGLCERPCGREPNPAVGAGDDDDASLLRWQVSRSPSS